LLFVLAQLLIERVYPFVARYAARRGFQFCPSEMRWGIREEASDRHETSAICMDELRRCKDDTPEGAVDYVLILADK
jgi:hypothetical protein